MQDAVTMLRSLIAATARAADPAVALAKHWAEHGDGFSPSNERSRERSVYLLASGKASMAMAREAIRHLGSSLIAGIVTAVPEHAGDLPRVRVMPADHPLATTRNIEAARAVEGFASACSPSDRVLVLLSGGASAHLTLPAGNLSLDDLREVTRSLQRAGASIAELNAVRKHCEMLKGGRLARVCRAASIHCCVLSDVIGDPLDAIGSGPFAPDPTTYGEALAIVDRFGLTNTRVVEHLRRGVAGGDDETPKAHDPAFARVRHTIVANNAMVVDAAAAAGRALGLVVASAQTNRVGEAAALGRELVQRAIALHEKEQWSGPMLVLAGGEPTVDARGSAGRGGPSQELALAALDEVLSLGEAARDLSIFAYSTDGIDGPTDAAGAIITPETIRHAATKRTRAAMRTEVRAGLANHDAHAALGRLGALLRTGPTGTNVNHVWGVLISRDR